MEGRALLLMPGHIPRRSALYPGQSG